MISKFNYAYDLQQMHLILKTIPKYSMKSNQAQKQEYASMEFAF